MAKHRLPIKGIVYSVVFATVYIALPWYLANRFLSYPLIALCLFYTANFAIAGIILRINLIKSKNFNFEREALQEKINITLNQNLIEMRNIAALKEKLNRYNHLKDIIEELNQNLSLDSIADHLTSIAFSLIAHHKGTCILYLIENHPQLNLYLFKTRKENEQAVVKSKQGDIFDHWMLRHGSSLFIDDIHKDFRFDLEKLCTQDSRPVASVISAPLISEHRFIGILRLDSPLAYAFSQEDLRFLCTIADVGAVALENGQLFKKTKDLAIHDELTSFYTKNYFKERLIDECSRFI